jgi:hypothetical protein
MPLAHVLYSVPRLALLEIPLVLNNTTGNRQNLEGKTLKVRENADMRHYVPL